MREFLPPEFGDGWMSKPARSMAQIAVVFGGFDAKEVRRRLALAGNGSRKMNVHTVGNVLQTIKNDHE